ncbi:ABC transporter ATP-binding protein [Pedobacter mucosus]|uniref:ABC transporter ATP-binding protein n=1 Tax=Pedobacter mucosus TaxID=2895286 RepID=UPI001EE3CB22|nr:ABC transporter ATP-binding protein [Pedobacter mucosus]UKT64403.1 ATP-binding cassette domain-containing protein [Pedobacter mucosus]
MSVAIKVENLSKAYHLGQIGTGTISRDLERWYSKMRGKDDPFLRIGESNNQNTKSESDVVWSLKDINFEIEQGDAVGIIGRNGAGKSTLLKILSKVTAPTTGRITGKGRIASLLEVGTGFHPELSGRENIFLNGAILGMRKKEIQRKLEEIVDFAGIERYLDTPVKRYSSGMYVRLAFAVAAHLESEILIVDEVLAVGDAEFQKKCLGKMSEVSKGEGRTVLFVSHNMGSILQLCNRGILLDNGLAKASGDIYEIIEQYVNDAKLPKFESKFKFEDFEIQNIEVSKGETGKDLVVTIPVESNKIFDDFQIALIIKETSGHIYSTLYSGQTLLNFKIIEGSNIVKCTIIKLPLNVGNYQIDLWIKPYKNTEDINLENVATIEVNRGHYYYTDFIANSNIHGKICISNKWERN